MRPSASQISLFVALILILTVSTFSYAAPSITSLNPTSGAVGASVTISGSGFGSSQGSSTVKFNGTTATSITTWNDGSIVAIVPSGATNGNVVVTVSGQSSNDASFTVTGVFSATGNMNTARNDFTATVLNNGKVLIVGGADNNGNALASAELYDAATQAFSATGSLNTGRWLHSAILLNNGKVLITGGIDASFNFLSSAELYDPASGTFSQTGIMQTGRAIHTATVLGNGTALVAGGIGAGFSPLASAELYNPATGTFAPAANMIHERGYHSALLLPNGKVLLAGGMGNAGITSTAELYDPSNNTFTATGSMTTTRYAHVSALLNDGRALVAAGYNNNYTGVATAEVYSSTNGTFSATGSLTTPAHGDGATATLLGNGTVLVAGGNSAGHNTAIAELYDPASGTFTATGSLRTARFIHTATLLNDGNVLIAGGSGISNLASAEIYPPTSLTPSGLVSIAVDPQTPTVPAGTAQAFSGTGTFADTSTQTLRSVTWTSSNMSVATVSNDASNRGTATALATGSTTVSACAGSVCGSTTMAVTAVLTSISITPSTPTVAIGAGQQLTATGTFSDNSTADLTTSVTWASSDSSIALIGSAPSELDGFAMGVSAGTATITATLGNVSSNTPITVQPVSTPNPPTITSVSPSAGSAGTQVTVSGTGFGATQATGTVWLGSTYGTVVGWDDTEITAVVADISTSGTVQVQQNGLFSNSVPFSVSSATISNISPTSGVPGTNVNITGSGFGEEQGNGRVWLGTAYGIVQSWSSNEVVAQVAQGSLSGSAQILQGGVWSNSVPFTVNSLHITTVTPNSGAPGTSVTITGTGFGSNQGYGVVQLGNTQGQVVTWSNTEITANVASSALSGVARVRQDGVWSNALTFTVPVSGGNTLTIVPNMLNLVVGETRMVQVLDQNGQSVTGLTWDSSDSNVVSLSTDDPPMLTALTAGHVTITAGTASTDVTVFNDALPPGTVIWSNPGNGSGVTNIVPAVPSAEGVADIFAFQADGTVQAIRSDGTTAWTADVTGAQSIPDFQGGLVTLKQGWNAQTSTIQKVDGLTGQPYPAYTVTKPDQDHSRFLGAPVVHTDGTVFAVDSNLGPYPDGTVSIIGIDPKTATQKFSVQFDQSTSSNTSQFDCDPEICFQGSRAQRSGDKSAFESQQAPTTTDSTSAPAVLGASIVAGDGFSYTPYTYSVSTSSTQETIGCAIWYYIYSPVSHKWDQKDNCETITYQGGQTTVVTTHLMLSRVGSDGSSSQIDVKDWTSTSVQSYFDTYTSTCYGASHPDDCIPSSSPWWGYTVSGEWVTTAATPQFAQANLITNADQGVLLTWEIDTPQYCASQYQTLDYSGNPTWTCSHTQAAATTYGIATTSVNSLTYSGATAGPVNPVLQGQDGMFYGSSDTGLIKFNQFGSVIWSVPGDYPTLGTNDGGVIGSTGIAYDDHGRAAGQGALPGGNWPSWQGFLYSSASYAVARAMPSSAFLSADLLQAAGGNVSGSGTTLNLPDDPWSLRLVPTSDDGAQGHPQRNITYTLYRLDGKTPPKGKWYVTEHLWPNWCPANCDDGMSGGIDQNQFNDLLGCFLGCEGTWNHQTFTVSLQSGTCGQPSYGNVQNTPCKSDGSGTIVVHSPDKLQGPGWGILWLWMATNDVRVNDLYRWPGLH